MDIPSWKSLPFWALQGRVSQYFTPRNMLEIDIYGQEIHFLAGKHYLPFTSLAGNQENPSLAEKPSMAHAGKPTFSNCVTRFLKQFEAKRIEAMKSCNLLSKIEEGSSQGCKNLSTFLTPKLSDLKPS